MKFIKIVPFLLGMLFLVTACEKDFEELRINPNTPVNVSPELLLPTIIRTPVNEMVGLSWNSGNVIVQQTAKIQFTWGPTYDLGGSDGLWSTMYNTLRDVNNVIEISTEIGNDNYLAIALIMKSWIYSILTDSFGDLPYTNATKAKSEDLLAPEYDSQEVIYNGILEDLTTANEIIVIGESSVSGDILFGGDMMKWKKLANSLRLRYLMRISNKKDVKAELQQIVNNPAQYPIFESVEDNATLTYLPSFPNQWPIHTYRVGSFDEYRLSKTFEDKLKALDDPRLEILARPTSASADTETPEYAGVPNGLNDNAALAYNGGSNNISRIGTRFYEDPDTEKGIILTYSELQFILAEAAAKNWIDGDVEEFYKNGIEAALEYYGITEDADYFEQDMVKLDLANPLPQIGLQKWIALFFNGYEAWFDIRRTKFPALVPVDGSDRIISRWQYPSEEQSLNKENYDAAIERQGSDNNKTLVWWEKN